MRKLKLLGLAFIACLTLAYLTVILGFKVTIPSSAETSNYPGDQYHYDKLYKVYMPNPSDHYDPSTGAYETTEQLEILNSKYTGHHDVHWIWYEFFCPTKTSLNQSNGKCDENARHDLGAREIVKSGTATVYFNNSPVSITTPDQKPEDFLKGSGFTNCGNHQNDFIIDSIDGSAQGVDTFGTPDYSGGNNWITYAWGAWSGQDCVSQPTPTITTCTENSTPGCQDHHSITTITNSCTGTKVIDNGFSEACGATCTELNNCSPTPTVTYGVTPTPTVTYGPTPTPPLLVVYKYVQGDGSKQPKDFTIHVTGTNVSAPQFQGDSDGVAVTLDPGDYSVTEDQLSGYTLTGRSAGCNGPIANNQTRTCVLINTQNGVTPTVTPTSTNTNNCNNTNQSGNTGGNNNNNCNQQNQTQTQNQYNNNNQTVNITYAQPAQQQQQAQVLGVSYPVYANTLPSTGPGDSLLLLGALTPLGFIIRKISGK